MSIANEADVSIGGIYYHLDQNYIHETGRRCYVHTGRSIFAGRTDISGRPGAQNLNPDNLVWDYTTFDGEGRVVYDADTPGLFYRSEGLNFRVPGQMSLNSSSLATTLLDSPSAANTYQGNADFTDLVGSSTTSGTDRKLVAKGDKIGMSANDSTGAGRVTYDFYLYRDGFGTTTINGSSLVANGGDTKVVGSEMILKSPGANVRTAVLVEPTNFTAGQQQRVDFYLRKSASDPAVPVAYTVQIAGGGQGAITRSGTLTNTSTPSDPTVSLLFTPTSGQSYVFYVICNDINRLVVNNIKYGPEIGQTSQATIEVWNQSAGSSVATQTINVTATSPGVKAGTIVFDLAAATNYRARVLRVNSQSASNQAIWVDKVVSTRQSTAAATWNIDAMEVGYSGKVFLAAHRAGTTTRFWNLNTSTNAWDLQQAMTGSSNETVYALAHTDRWEYALTSGGVIYRSDNSTGPAYTTNAITTLAASLVGVGMCIAQDRIMVLTEDSTNGVRVYGLDVDAAVGTWSTLTATGTRFVSITTANNTADLTHRQRMCSTPTGGRFYVNYSDTTAKIYEVDASGSSMIYRELADLGHGVKATAIAYEGGITFIAGQFTAESDQTPRTALWYIDQNGVLQRIGFFRYDNPNSNPVNFLTPYQTNLYMVQGPYVWRYSLTTGGLFLEYQLQPTDATQARGLAVLQGRTMVAYGDDGSGSNSSEVWLTGAVSTYRQSAVDGGNQFTTSDYDFNLPGFDKHLISIQVLTDTLSSGAQVQVEYQINQNGTWTSVGTATAGNDNTFLVAQDGAPVVFNSLQCRLTPASTSGSVTPVVKALSVRALPAESEEFFELVLLCNDEDPAFHIDGQQVTGADAAGNLYSLWRSKTPTTFLDGYVDKMAGVATQYLVRVDDFRDERNDQGEGRVVVSLRVLA